MSSKRRPTLSLRLIAAALLLRWANADLVFTSVAVGDVSQDIKGNQVPIFSNVKTTGGLNGDAYEIAMEVENAGQEGVQLQQVDITLYAGVFNESSPPRDAVTIPVDASGVAQALPTIPRGQKWPDGGLKFLIPGSSIPETTTCSPYDVTVAVNATIKPSTGSNSVETDYIPLRVISDCISRTASPQGEQLNTKASFAFPYTETNQAQLPFLIDFGEKVLELDPLKLFTVVGSNRTDVVYDVEQGRIYLMVYPDDPEKPAEIQVNVPAGATSTASNIPNGAANAYAQYQPKIGAIRTAALALTGVFAGVVAAAWLTSFIVSSMQPWATAGSLGYGSIAFVLWAQKLYLTGLLSMSTMPANYRTMSEVFAWADFQAEFPWNWGQDDSPGGVTRNLTRSSAIFETNAMVLLDANTGNFKDYYSSIAGAVAAPPPPLAPAPAPAPSQDIAPISSLVSNVPPSQAPPAKATQQPPKATDAPPAEPDSCTVSQNMDLFGGDIPNTRFLTTDAQLCCNACLANPACFAWTLSLIDNQCYLKAEKGWQVRMDTTCCLSGTANRNGVPFVIPIPSPPPPPPKAPPGPKQTTGNAGGAGGGNNNNNNSGGGGSGGGNNNNSGGGGGGGNNNNNNNNSGGGGGGGGGNNNNNNNNNSGGGGGGGNNNNNDNNNNNNGGGGGGNRRLLTPKTGPALNPPTNVVSTRHLQQIEIIDTPSDVNVRYILVSTGSGFVTVSQPPTVLTNEDAGSKVRYIVSSTALDDALSPYDKQENPYEALERVGFWVGCVFMLTCLVNFCSWLLVRCCEGEVPGVLYVPRMQLIILMLCLSALAYTGSRLFSKDYGLVPMSVGIAAVVCGPVLFLLSSYIGIAAAVYRKKKAVYLLSSRTNPEDPGEVSKWDRMVVGSWMGMSLNRGKWRPADPARKNEFVFRWGPLFEDCRGPLYQRRKTPANDSPGSMRRHNNITSTGSDHSSQSGGNRTYSSLAGVTMPRSSSRRKVVQLEEKPLTSCGRRKLRRSSFQAYGIVVSVARICGYAMAIGALGSWPIVQSAVLLAVAVLYCIYLRLTVPYSRRDEMALEYWSGFLDVALFAIFMMLSAGVGETDFPTIDALGLGLIVIQCVAFFSYLVNRLLIIYHAFAEVVCAACSCAPASPKRKRSKSKRRRSNTISRSASASFSISDISYPSGFPPDTKAYYLPDGTIVLADGKESGSGSGSEPQTLVDGVGNGVYAAPQQLHAMMYDQHSQQAVQVENRVNSRTARSGMFPAIAEETDSQIDSPAAVRAGEHMSQPNSGRFQAQGPKAVPIAELITGVAGPAVEVSSPTGSSSARRLPGGSLARQPTEEKRNAVFDKFWQSL